MRKNTSFGFLWLLPFLMLYYIFFLKKKKSTMQQSTGMTQKETEFRDALRSLPLSEKQKKFVYGVSYHETGGFTSSLCVNTDNYFGMRPARKREKFYIGITKSNYAIYDGAKNSLQCFLGWWKFHKESVPEEIEGGVLYMAKKGYFSDSISNYKRGVENGAKKW